MAYIFGSSGGGIFVSSVVSEQVYDPVFDTAMPTNNIWELLPDFYKNLMDDKDIMETVWSGTMQQVSGDLLNLWQIDYAKSLRDVPTFSQRKWVHLDFYKEFSFVKDVGSIDYQGLASTLFVPSPSQDEIVCTYTTRARSDVASVDLTHVVNEAASLTFSVEIAVTSAEPFSSALWGYFGSHSIGAQLTNFLGFMLRGAESASDSPTPALLFVDGAGIPTVSISAFVLEMDTSYRCDVSYTAGTGVAVLEVYELRYLKLTGSGDTLGEHAEIFTNFFQDQSTNFDAEGVVPGDILVVLGADYEILSVDGDTLTVKVVGLPVALSGLGYEVRGPTSITSCSLDLPGDASDPTFTVTRFGTGNLDVRSTTAAVYSSLATLRNKRALVSSSSWSYLDPAFSSRVVSVPRIQDRVTNPDVLLTEGTDYYVVDSVVLFQEPPAFSLWAEYVAYDENYIYENFGVNVGLTDISSDQYKARVRGLYYSYWQGPTVTSIRQGVHILAGLPIAEKPGTVEAINTAYSGVLGVITVSGKDYLYPLVSGTDLVVGDSVSSFEPLCKGVEIVDHVLDPEWFVGLSLQEIEKVHTFAIYLNLDVFSVSTLGLVSQFLDQIKPTWKDYVFVAFKELEDTYIVDDSLSLTVVLNLYDQPCDHPVVQYDGYEFEGDEADWKYDQSLTDWDETSAGMRGTAAVLLGTATLTSASTGATGFGTSWTADIGSGAVVNKYVAVALYTTGALDTVAGSNDLYSAGSSFGDIAVGDMITVAGEGTFEVVTVTNAANISVDGPMASTATSVAWSNVGKLNTWGQVASVASNTSLTWSAAFAGTTGTYVLALLDNDYREAYYDSYSEACPDEELEIVITYTGVSPPTGPITVPGVTGTTTYNFTFTGDSYSVILTEQTP